MSDEEVGWRPPPRPPWVERMDRAGCMIGDPAQIMPLDGYLP